MSAVVHLDPVSAAVQGLVSMLPAVHVPEIRTIDPDDWLDARLFRSARRDCDVCRGTGFAPLDVVSEPDEHGERHTRSGLVLMKDTTVQLTRSKREGWRQCDCSDVWIALPQRSTL